METTAVIPKIKPKNSLEYDNWIKENLQNNKEYKDRKQAKISKGKGVCSICKKGSGHFGERGYGLCLHHYNYQEVDFSSIESIVDNSIVVCDGCHADIHCEDIISNKTIFFKLSDIDAEKLKCWMKKWLNGKVSLNYDDSNNLLVEHVHIDGAWDWFKSLIDAQEMDYISELYSNGNPSITYCVRKYIVNNFAHDKNYNYIPKPIQEENKLITTATDKPKNITEAFKIIADEFRNGSIKYAKISWNTINKYAGNMDEIIRGKKITADLWKYEFIFGYEYPNRPRKKRICLNAKHNHSSFEDLQMLKKTYIRMRDWGFIEDKSKHFDELYKLYNNKSTKRDKTAYKPVKRVLIDPDDAIQPQQPELPLETPQNVETPAETITIDKYSLKEEEACKRRLTIDLIMGRITEEKYKELNSYLGQT